MHRQGAVTAPGSPAQGREGMLGLHEAQRRAGVSYAQCFLQTGRLTIFKHEQICRYTSWLLPNGLVGSSAAW